MDNMNFIGGDLKMDRYVGYSMFDPKTVSRDDLKALGEHIENYIDELERVMIIPEEIMEEYGDQIKEGIKRTRKLISKLKKGDTSVFRDDYDDE